MSGQAEFLKNVRENLNQMQQKATARLEAFNGNARKIFTEAVEKGKNSQKELTERLSRLASAEALQHKVKPVADTAIKQVSFAREKARSYVTKASRDQALAVAGELRKVAARLDELGCSTQAPSSEATLH